MLGFIKKRLKNKSALDDKEISFDYQDIDSKASMSDNYAYCVANGFITPDSQLKRDLHINDPFLHVSAPVSDHNQFYPANRG